MNETWWVGENQLDPDQKKIIGLPIDEDHLILGPPGSGKTNLLLLRANYLHTGGYPNVLFLVFTRTLQEFLASGAANYRFSTNKIQTYSYWQKKFLGEHAVTPSDLNDFDAQRASLCNQMTSLVDSEGISNYYDAIVLDEGQDCLPQELHLFKRLAKVLFVSADAKQQIYKGKDSVSTLLQLIPSVVTLQYHYRCGKKICALADEIGKASKLHEPMLDSCNYDEEARPSEANLIRCPDLRMQCQKIVSALKTQLIAYNDEMLGVLCPRREDLQFVGDFLKNSEIGEQVIVQSQNEYSPFFAEKRICVCTINSAKGLEFRALHLAAFDEVKKFRERQRRLAYTAVTRAKTTLTAYYSGELPGFLESAFAAINPKPKLEISKAFGN